MFLSVVICTYDRYSVLPMAIESAYQSLCSHGDRFELIVVENTPVEKRQKIILPKDERCRVLTSETPGLSIARNLGIRASNGDVVVFLDDDAVCSKYWAMHLSRALQENPKALVVGGKVKAAFEKDLSPQWYSDSFEGYFSCIDWGDSDRYLEPGEWLVGANIAFRREVFSEFGYFDEALGRKGAKSLLSNEETALFKKVGFDRVFYCADAAVDHFIPMERVSMEWLRKRVYWQAVSDLLSGEAYIEPNEASEELDSMMPMFPPENRNLKSLWFTPETKRLAELQLRAIYLSAIVMASGEDVSRKGVAQLI